ncbi:hypothetical protein L226DRAFT_253047 [Lentinus tigrinus ALCF2SS1-7]|uniref:uncharacterized protein n=1 Tax=Lentinus tigrinus ALCF2SS1-7 TaxID=1328758 RepID=UPI001165FCE3|nr:hypothetical protein L226DRAFT_253047 [Lentinus tigrinus ALCF2SS1-7]
MASGWVRGRSWLTKYGSNHDWPPTFISAAACQRTAGSLHSRNSQPHADHQSSIK